MALFIANLPYHAAEADLSALFRKQGFEVAKCTILKDRSTGRSRGLALVDLIDPNADEIVINELHGIRLFGRELKIKKDERSPLPKTRHPQHHEKNDTQARLNADLVRRQRSEGLDLRANEAHRHNNRDCDAVPMEFRAQVEGRCQRQYFKSAIPCRGKSAPAISHWIEEWTSASETKSPFQIGALKSLVIQIDWRLMANSGLDEGMIRPVIAVGAWPIIPGSSIKGLFRKACLNDSTINRDKLLRWCGTTSQSGIIRFHGAWPSDPSWKTSLLDLTHAQESWQLGIDDGRHSANVLLSLHQPRLIVAYSSRDAAIDDREWIEIETTLRDALAMGIGGRTAAGYGSCGISALDPLFSCNIEGRFPTAKLLDRKTEFRPTMFRAAMRGMALRLFAGLTKEKLAKQAVENLFGTLQSTYDGKPKAGLLAMAFHLLEGSRETGTIHDQEFTSVVGKLQWTASRPFRSGEDREKLVSLLAALHGLVMTLSGFGRSWRRPDHAFFYRNYTKKLIGCHWQWRSANDPHQWIDISSLEQLGVLLSHSRRIAQDWLKQTNCLHNDRLPSWREVMDPERMQVWGRLAGTCKDAKAIYWFHERPAIPSGPWANPSPTALFRTDLAGRVVNKEHDNKKTLVSSIWNRMLPIIDCDHPHNNTSRLVLHQGRYLEILVIFDHPGIRQNPSFESFLSFLNSSRSPFRQISYS